MSYKSIYEYIAPTLYNPTLEKIRVGNVKGREIYWHPTGDKLYDILETMRETQERKVFILSQINKKDFYESLIILL